MRAEQGQTWTHTVRGRRKTYVIEQMETHGHPRDIAKIRNVDTDGIGWVTRHWLMRKADGPDDARGQFEYVAQAELAEAA